MQVNFKTLALSSAAFCATAAFAANQARVDVPFSFTAEGQSFPAGMYDVTMDMNHNCITLTNEGDAGKHIMWTAGPADRAKTSAVVRFDQLGSDHALKNIQFGERVTPNLDKKAKGAKGGVSATTSISGE